MLTKLNISVSSCHLPTLSQALFGSWKSHSPQPEVLRILGMKVDINSWAGLVLEGVHTFLFSLSLFWPTTDRFTSRGTPAFEREKWSPLFKGGSSGRKTQAFFEENNKGVIMVWDFNSKQPCHWDWCLLFLKEIERIEVFFQVKCASLAGSVNFSSLWGGFHFGVSEEACWVSAFDRNQQ